MEDNTSTLKVKFNWTLRKRAFPAVDHGERTDLGRTAKYMRNLKERDSTKYREHLKRDANRKREGYITIENKTNSEKEQQRKKWLGWKKKQREKKKCTECSKVKRFKDMTVEEKKIYYKMKMRSYRAKMSKQKKISEKKKNRERKKMSTEVDTPYTTQQLRVSGNGSRATFYRRKKELSRVMPKSPRGYGKMVEALVSGNTATPKKVQNLKKRGIRRRLEEDLIAENVKANIRHLSSSYKNKDRQALHAIVTASTTLPICADTELCDVTQTPPDLTVSQQKQTAPPKVVRGYLGVSRRSWRRVRQHRKGGEFITQVKKKRSGIPNMVAETVRNFWLSPTISRPLPLKKRVKHGIPTHLLECSYSTAYQRFKAEHPEIKLGYVKFIKLRPRNVRHMRLADRNVCCCNKCENIKLKLKAINQLAVKSEHSKALLGSDEASLSNMTMCKFDNSRFPPKPCIDRKCAECGVQNITNHLQALLNTEATTKLKYQEWQRVEKRINKNKAERIIKVVDLVDAEATLGELVKKLETELIKFSGHLFRAKWQQRQLKMAKEKINPKSAVVIMDYAENYTCTSQDEVQSAHWVTQAVTIHPMMAYINASSQEGTITNSEALIFISDDLKHDADGVAHFTSIAYPHLQQKYGISHVEEFSDCCAVQYRCGKSFADISFARDVTVRHNYFEASHGKSAADGMGAITKHAASMAVTRRQYTIRNAKEFFEFCEAELTDVGKSVFQSQSTLEKNSSSFRSFFYCENIDRNRKDRDAKTVKGTMNIHCVSGMNEPYKIRIRDLSCTCDYCWTGSGDGCQEERYVGAWRTVELHLKQASVVREEKRPQMDNPPATEEIIPSCSMGNRGNEDTNIDPEQTNLPCESEQRSLHSTRYEADDFVAVRLQTTRGKKKMYLAKVVIVEKDLHLSFLCATKKPGVYTWPRIDDMSWQAPQDIIGKLSEPHQLPGRGVKLQFDIDELHKCISHL